MTRFALIYSQAHPLEEGKPLIESIRSRFSNETKKEVIAA